MKLVAAHENKLYLALALAFVGAFSLDWALTDAMIQDENYAFVRYYTDPGEPGHQGVLSKIYNVCQTDSCLSRNRPLGSLLGMIDAKLMIGLNRWLPLDFRSVLHGLLTLATVLTLGAAIPPAIGWRGSPAFAWMLAAFFAASSQALVLNSIYFRPAKDFASWSTALALLAWVSFRGGAGRGRVSAVGLGLGVCTLADEQVAFALAVLGALSALDWARSRKFPAFLAAAAIALAFHLVNLLWISPALSAAYTPHGRVADYATGFLAFDFKQALIATNAALFQIGMLFGNPEDGTYLVPLAGLAMIILASRLSKPSSGVTVSEANLPLPDVPLVVASVFALVYLMGLRHPPIFWDDIKRGGYYYLPSALLLYVCALRLFSAVGVFSSPLRRTGFASALLACAIANHATQPATRDFVWGKHLSGCREENRVFARALRGEPGAEGEVARLKVNARGFFEYFLERTGRRRGEAISGRR